MATGQVMQRSARTHARCGSVKQARTLPSVANSQRSGARSARLSGFRTQAAAVSVAEANEAVVVQTLAKPTVSPAELATRHQSVLQHFPTALGQDDFIARVEVALCGFGFTGDTTIAMTNLCRDEVTTLLKDKIEAVFGSSFNTNGLGAVLTCGATGIGAGLSHSPICVGGRERYVFFSFPHIAIDGSGNIGVIYRPGRPGTSCACGALAKSLGELKAEGVDPNCKTPGVHDPVDPEYSILKQRLARRIRYEQLDVGPMTLTDLTNVAERIITDDLEHLIAECVNDSKADYAVITGVQIHNWAVEGTAQPHLEFVAPSKAYAVVNGQRTDLDLFKIPALTPRQISLLAHVAMGQHAKQKDENSSPAGISVTGTRTSTLYEISETYLSKRLGAPML